MINPEILLMDEWLSVGDRGFQEKAEKKLTDLVNRTKILVLATHSRALVEKCCNRAIWLEHGNLVMDGDAEEVCEKYFSRK